MFSLPFLMFILFYIYLGPVSWGISSYEGEYPGPLMIGVPDRADTLLIHGATIDARAWSHLIAIDDRFVAISVADQEKGPHLADVGVGHLDIINFLESHRNIKYIVAHSSGAIWLVNAYASRPDLFNGVKTLLMAPNLGYVTPNDVEQFLFDNSFILPNPFLRFLEEGDTTFDGVDHEHYKDSKNIYYSGKKSSFYSMSYFRDLQKLMHMSQNNVKNFLESYKDLEVYLATEDMLINFDELKAVLAKYRRKPNAINNSSHQGILLEHNYKVWRNELN